MAIDTSTTQGIYDAVRARLLTFVRISGGSTLDTLLRALPTNPVTYSAAGTARLYVGGPPDTLVYPYGMIMLGPRVGDGEHHGEREATELEVIFVHRPRSKFWELQVLADIADQAMLRWSDASDPLGGFLGSKGRVRQTIPQAPIGSPADRDVVQEMIRYPIISWPHFLNQYHTAA